MLKKALVTIAVLFVAFLAYVASKPSHFRYERSGLISAKPDQLYPYISDFVKGREWSPFEKDAQTAKYTLGGTPQQPGSYEDFDSKSSGKGRIEITAVKPNEQVDLMLHMTEPMAADNRVIYKLTPEGEQTRFTWIMEGDGGFLGKLVSTVIDCEKMIGGQFEEGIANLKKIAESKKIETKQAKAQPLETK